MELRIAQPSGGTVDAVVIGAGVIGLSSAVSLAEAGLRVRVDTAAQPGKSTSFAAGAAWEPYLVQPYERVADWGRTTLRKLTRIAGQGPHTGVRIRAGSHQSRLPCDLPYWADAVGRGGASRESSGTDSSRDGGTGRRSRTWACTSTTLCGACPTPAGTSVRTPTGRWPRPPTRRLWSSTAPEPVPAHPTRPDPDVRPVRGDLVIVENPGIDTFFCDDTPGTTEYTRHDGIHLHLSARSGGGPRRLAEAGRWSTAPDPETVGGIIERCAAVEPALRNAHVVGYRVGLRPTRGEVCLREDSVPAGRLLHNLGHGGAGFSLSWGCAAEITAMVLGGGPEEAAFRPS